ncbi:tetratricopeptide repeat protein [Umezawaea sp. Da 62-37]|uniref:ATP-binding protein n=1 Tax=Umezawaea sp. Da 62-37 TaxID=3075927 RepID=UPI0028F6E178|nr:tetratricopeptide repeat protein [Umezawaea sp. Da 62-37]WNV86690.1 tetratricopeptide repeat protein [Umezawaea sp. Da 62-37]WNV86727.1 tetratricopeptide repeat protein [Umezawaea sp. Da 62-37]
MTPEPEQPEDPEAAGRGRGGEPEVRNTVSGAAGAVVQAGVMHGDVHLHAAPPPAPVVPRQLPAAPVVFAGRVAESAELDRVLTAVPGSRDAIAAGTVPVDPAVGTAVMISAIGGTGGVGKTWLALAWAHRNLHRFPDGQLFVDLRGFSPTGRPVEPGDAVRGFLDALGVDPGGLPPELATQTALYRSLVAGRRMLIVLDNAATADQVVPLLPGSPTCTVLVTGRTTLPSLIDRHGARHLQLDVLTHDEARVLLAARLGDERVAAEPGATAELIGLCGRHPLALTITARHAATRPTIPLVEFATELRDLGLEMLDHDDPDASLPTVLSWSLRHLTEPQRRVFALLGITPGPDTDLSAVTSLTGLPPPQTRKILRVLEEHSLLDRHPHGRYAMHDLVRAYAVAYAHDTLPEPARTAALERVTDFYLHTASAADRLLDPHGTPTPLDPSAPGTRPHPLSDHAAALAWFDTHHSHLLAVQRTAALHHRHQIVWNLARTLGTLHWRRGHRHDDLAVWQAATDAADHLPSPATRSYAHQRLGHAHAVLGGHEQAITHLRQALALAELHQDLERQAHIHHTFAQVWELRGDNGQALVHAHHALDLFRVLGQPGRVAITLNQVGWFAACLGDYDTARTHCQAALSLHRSHHNLNGQAATLDSLAFVEHHTGHHLQAVDHYRQALTLFRTLGHTAAAADVLDSLGRPHAALGHHAQTGEVWREALELYRQLGRTTDADRVQRQLDDLDPEQTSIRPS